MDDDKGKPSPKTRKRPPVSEASETRLLIEYAFDMAEKLEIRNVFVRADQVIDRRLVEKFRSSQTVYWLVRSEDENKGAENSPENVIITIPRSRVGGIDEVTVGVTTAVLEHKLQPEETAICLTGVAGSKRLDNLLVVNPERDMPWFRDHKMSLASKRIASAEGIRILEIALRFAAEGREGKPVGTIFLLGNTRSLSKYIRPLILNPLSGHAPENRSIHNAGFFETLRELAAMDGAFVVNTKGIVEQACVFLNAPMSKKIDVKEGLGTRHVAAAAMSAKTNCVTFVLSESSGKVTVFAAGASILELDGRS